eukprot:CAMPEP_0117677076 /NCGR_PEP_ID=MMETSP0804-20121206/16549_1 /TAXON_ID=1074897 /ORGANISM="Tetraselmis astigmatica, Strain CCMP880" /LENGTH=209 /DNA_ID=CAMNT_0005486329 /DNA_START=47 /DNA_END=677 /DNA_ORIENTATION=-
MSSKWNVAFEDLSGSRGRVATPPGYNPSVSYEEAPKGDRAASSTMVKKQQEALWARAQAPMKQVGMMCFMQWMMGNQAHLMTILMVVGIIYNYVSQILQSGTMFRSTNPELDTFGPRMAFVGVQAGGLAFAMYKLNGMGLLPTHPSDWFDSTVPTTAEFSVGGAALAPRGHPSLTCGQAGQKEGNKCSAATQEQPQLPSPNSCASSLHV